MSSSEQVESQSLFALPDRELLRRLGDLVHRSRHNDADLLVHLGEVDARRLYLEDAYPSMFAYCVRALHFEEGVAYNRIYAARAVRRHPELVAALRRGELHVTGIRLLASQLTQESCAE